MATVEKRQGKNGIAYRITVASGIDSNGKQIRVRRTWTPPKPDMTERQIEKALARAVADFEREIEQGYVLNNKQSFAEYAKYVIDLKRRTGTKIRTVERYSDLLIRINKAIGHLKLADIRPQHLNNFYESLAKEGVRLDNTRATIKIDLMAWINEHGYSIHRFSKLCGISEVTVASIIKGKSVTEASANAVAAAIGVPVSSIFNVIHDTTPLSNKTILEHHRCISSVFSQAVKELLIPANPASNATPPKAKPPSPDYYQPDEVSKILDALEEAPLKWRAATYFLIDTGCRRGEACGLKWDSIDFEGHIVVLDKALLYSRRIGTYEDTTKSDRERILQISPETINVLRLWKAEQDNMKDAYGSLWVNTGYIFTRNNGDHMNPDSLTDWLNKFSKKHDLPHIHPHAFRHTSASTMIANNVDIVSVAGELGHASPVTTTKIYAHQIAEAKARASNVRMGIFQKKAEN